MVNLWPKRFVSFALVTFIGLSPYQATAGPKEVCSRLLCNARSTCSRLGQGAKDLTAEIIASRGRRVVLRNPSPEQIQHPGWLGGFLTPNPDPSQDGKLARTLELAPLTEAVGKYLFDRDGYRFTPFNGLHQLAFVTPVRKFMNRVLKKDLVPTLFASIMTLTIPSSMAVHLYFDFEQARSALNLDRLIETDLRFEPILQARQSGTIDQDASRFAAIQLKQLWEEYTPRLLNGPFLAEDLQNDVLKAERGEFPFQHLRELFNDGVQAKPGARVVRDSSNLSSDERLRLVGLTHHYNLRLVILGDLLNTSETIKSGLRVSAANAVMEELRADPFVRRVLSGVTQKRLNSLQAYHILQEDIQNQMDLAIAQSLGITFIHPQDPRQSIDIEDLREELLSDHQIKL